jgi:hypothetical protein
MMTVLLFQRRSVMIIKGGARAPTGFAKSEPKLSDERMRIAIQSLQERPILAVAADKAGIHRKTLAYWLKSSKAGRPGYDVEWEGIMSRFHIHCEVAQEAPFERLKAIAWQLAMGIVFKVDPFLAALGYEGHDSYARDKEGNFITEQRGRPSGKWIRCFLEMSCPERLGAPRKVRASHATDPARQWNAWKGKIPAG